MTFSYLYKVGIIEKIIKNILELRGKALSKYNASKQSS